jgi:hypothetical protein
MYGYGYRYNSGLVVGAGGGAPFANISSLQFDGIDDFVDAGASTLSGETALSISAWVYPTAYGDATAPSFVSTDAASPRAFYLGLFNGRNFRFSLSTNATNLTSLDTAIDTVDLNTWQHILVTWNQVNLKLYKNGTLLKTVATTFASNGTFTTANDLLIGARRSDAGFFNGNIDEVALFNRVVTPAEIVTLSTAPTVDLTDLNPLAWYRMGDNGAWKSPQWLIPNNENFAANKVSNYSFELDGVDDYIDLNRPTELISATNFSISCWFKTPLNALGGIYTWFGGSSGWIELNCFPDGSMYALVTAIVGSAKYGLAPVGTITANTWYNSVMVFDGGGATNADRLKLYINGSLIPLSFVGTIPTQTGTMLLKGLHIGERYSGVQYLEGNIDEVSLFSNSLTQQNVTDLYNGGTPTTISGAVSNWKMGEDATFSGGVWTVPDAVGSNNGTSANMTIEDRIGEAPNSINNALSFNMDEVDRVTDVPPTIPPFNVKSLSFDGIDDYVDLTSSVDLGINSTISAWIKRSDIYNYDTITGESSYSLGTGIYIAAHQRVRVMIGSFIANWYSFNGYGILNQANTWIHLAFVRQGDDATLYLNGSSVGLISGFGTSITTKFDRIGAFASSGASPVFGNLDEVVGFDRAVTPAEIATLSTAPTVDLTSLNPLAWYRNGDGDTYPTITDNGSGGNSGTMTNMDAGDIENSVPN